MKISIIKGMAFGLTSGIITTLGMMVGLFSFTGSKLVVIGGILSIAIADSFSDALGIHISEESENGHTVKEIWMATLSTFLAKLVFSLTFVIPVLLLDVKTAILISIAWGMIMLGIMSYIIGKNHKESPFRVVLEHLFIAIIVIVTTYVAGYYIGVYFGA